MLSRHLHEMTFELTLQLLYLIYYIYYIYRCIYQMDVDGAANALEAPIFAS